MSHELDECLLACCLCATGGTPVWTATEEHSARANVAAMSLGLESSYAVSAQLEITASCASRKGPA